MGHRRHASSQKRVRTVELCAGSPLTEGSYRLWAFGIPVLARLLGVSEGAVRARLARGGGSELNPLELETVCRAWALAHGWTPPVGGEGASRPVEPTEAQRAQRMKYLRRGPGGPRA